MNDRQLYLVWFRASVDARILTATPVMASSPAEAGEAARAWHHGKGWVDVLTELAPRQDVARAYLGGSNA